MTFTPIYARPFFRFNDFKKKIINIGRVGRVCRAAGQGLVEKLQNIEIAAQPPLLNFSDGGQTIFRWFNRSVSDGGQHRQVSDHMVLNTVSQDRSLFKLLLFEKGAQKFVHSKLYAFACFHKKMLDILVKSEKRVGNIGVNRSRCL